MSLAAVKIVSGVHPPAIPGVYFRLLCMTGVNKGKSYYLNSKRIVIGRDDSCDIKVEDTKASREHAELAKVGSSYVITDLGSQNGVLVNELSVKQHNLVDGDKVVIGHTLFKFSVFNIKDSPLKEVEDSLSIHVEEKKETKKNSNKKLIYGIVAVLVLSLLFLDEEQGTPGKKRKSMGPAKQVREENFKDFVRRSQSSDVDEELMFKVEAAIHRGLREHREKNYFRAIEEFNLALIMSPNNDRASFYLRKTKQKLEEEIKANFEKANREMEALKYRAAIVSNCSVIRLLQNYTANENEDVKKAEENIRAIESTLGLEKNEIKCFETK